MAVIFLSPITLGLLASIIIVLKYAVQILTSRPRPLSDQGHNNSTNEDKALKIEFGVAILIALTFLISFIVFVLTNSIMTSMAVFISMLPSMAVLYAIVYAFLEYWQESTSQPSSQSSYQLSPNPPSGTSGLFPQNLAQTRNPLSGQGHCSSTNEDKTMKIVCTVFITIVLTFLVNFFIVALTFHGSYSYSMYLKPGIYIFTPNGNYYYYHPYGWPASNTTLVVLGGGNIDINDWVYIDTVTVQPGNYSFSITLTNPNIMFNYFIDTIPTSVLISLIIAIILCELVARSEKTRETFNINPTK
jgi:hypothetical protein